jgi:phosphoribosylformimino-5-aminoimidazole carboxamide ribonucleotide (ProFAR) isomerase
MLFQRNLAEVARLNGLSAANRAEGRTEEAFQMFFRLWEGVVRLGGDIESFEDPVNEHERREFFLGTVTSEMVETEGANMIVLRVAVTWRMKTLPS